MAEPAALSRRLDMLKKVLPPRGRGVKSESLAWSQVQGALSRGDIKIAEVLANMDGATLAGWRQAVAKCQLDIDYYVLKQWDIDRPLPWGMLDLGVPRERLVGELKRALAQ